MRENIYFNKNVLYKLESSKNEALNTKLKGSKFFFNNI